MTNKEALELIEWLVSGDLAEDLSFYLHKDRDIPQKDAVKAAEIIGEVYKVAHSVLRDIDKDGCRHTEWLENAELLYDEVFNDTHA